MTGKNLHLGFEIPSGDPVEIPLNHTVITGQTQMAGKTTALEALIDRSPLIPALAFITKRGEGTFQEWVTIPPYFREQADWQYVASILEASRGEKLKFERAWIIRAAKGAKTLADVQRNVREALEKAKGLSADVYLTLDAYLDAVVPQIDAIRWAQRIELAPGINVMDLTRLNIEMQHLVIRSSIDWVLNKETDTVVIVPEAWKFIPEGRGTPVKLAAEGFIRQAAALRNYLWLDSQDIAGISKLILKSVPVWLLGVQREANEVKRTLDQIPAGTKKPKPEAVATLGLGEFFACYGTHVIKVYVQPAWLSEESAKAIAKGEIPAGSAQMLGQHIRQARKTLAAQEWPREDDIVVVANGVEADWNKVPEGIKGMFDKGDHVAVISSEPEIPEVNEREAQELRDENERLRATVRDLSGRLERTQELVPAPAPSGDGEPVPIPMHPTDFGMLYEAIKKRLLNDAERDPKLLRVLTVKPELEVSVQKVTIEVDGTSLPGRVAKLLHQGFFRDHKTQSAVRTELKRTGTDVNAGNLSKVVNKLVSDGFLVNESAGYREVAGMKVNIIKAA